MIVKTVEGYDIHFEALIEHSNYSEHMEDVDVIEIDKKLNDGELVLFCAKVSAHREGIELSSDYLGACIYKSEDEFVTAGDYFDDMVLTVINEANEVIKKLCQK